MTLRSDNQSKSEEMVTDEELMEIFNSMPNTTMKEMKLASWVTPEHLAYLATLLPQSNTDSSTSTDVHPNLKE